MSFSGIRIEIAGRDIQSLGAASSDLGSKAVWFLNNRIQQTQEAAFLFGQIFHFIHECVFLRLCDELQIFPVLPGEPQIKLKREGDQVSFRLPEENNWKVGAMEKGDFVEKVFTLWESWTSYTQHFVPVEYKIQNWVGDFPTRFLRNSKRRGEEAITLEVFSLEMRGLLLDSSDEMEAKLYPETDHDEQNPKKGWWYLSEMNIRSNGDTQLYFRFNPFGSWVPFFEEGIYQILAGKKIFVFPKAGINHLSFQLEGSYLLVENLEQAVRLNARDFFQQLGKAFVDIDARIGKNGKYFRSAPKLKETTGGSKRQILKKMEKLISSLPEAQPYSEYAFHFAFASPLKETDLASTRPPFSPHGYIEGFFSIKTGHSNLRFPVSLQDLADTLVKILENKAPHNEKWLFAPCYEDEIHPEPFLEFMSEAEGIRIFVNREELSLQVGMTEKEQAILEGKLGIQYEEPILIAKDAFLEETKNWLKEWEEVLLRWKLIPQENLLN